MTPTVLFNGPISQGALERAAAEMCRRHAEVIDRLKYLETYWN